MSTPVKKVIRPVKPKTTPVPAQVVTVTTEATETPVTEVSPALVEDTTGKRQQTSKAIGVNISSARTRRHLDKLNLNNQIDLTVSEIKHELTQYQAAKNALDTKQMTVQLETETEVDGKKVKQVQMQTRDLTAVEHAEFTETFNRLSPLVAPYELRMAALTRERTRFSSEAPIALSIVLDELSQQLLEHAMDNALASKKKIIQIEHLLSQGVDKLSLYPLFMTLPSFSQSMKKIAKDKCAVEEQQKVATLLAQAEKDFKKKYTVQVKKAPKNESTDTAKAEVVKPADVPKVDAPTENSTDFSETHSDDADDEEADSKTSFQFYVGQVCKELIKKDKYKTIRVSSEIRTYLSTLLIELIQRLARLVQLTTASMKNKTVNDVAILRTVEGILIDGHAPVETFEYVESMVPDHTIHKAEIAKKESERLAGRKYMIDLDSIPKVAGLVAVRHIVYPTAGYAALHARVQEKLALHEDLSKKKPEETV